MNITAINSSTNRYTQAFSGLASSSVKHAEKTAELAKDTVTISSKSKSSGGFMTLLVLGAVGLGMLWFGKKFAGLASWAKNKKNNSNNVEKA